MIPITLFVFSTLKKNQNYSHDNSSLYWSLLNLVLIYNCMANCQFTVKAALVIRGEYVPSKPQVTREYSTAIHPIFS